ncbi:hypothetical protein LX32DRAFT_635630 [Colletotrichum zoysiae]|uniref:Uncharacterized protein n=1 Tax=Colletotrichum zoysiae TaxID=1216348 RepID=A0AAD9HPM9_9PEZI|nr:hypothetical protein LX32DRAFT_635630 [Colletotrichum zoysiae]
MKISIIKALTFSLFVSVTTACDRYSRCRCTMNDETINNTVTEEACDYLYKYSVKKYADLSVYKTKDKDEATWCYQFYNDNSAYLGVNNCDMRVSCSSVGATGNDSWCEGKIY